MAKNTIAIPRYPDLPPKAKGVPSIFTDPTKPVFSTLLLIADVVSVLRMFQGPQWGVFKNGNPVAIPDSVISVDFRREWRISDYPVEQGGFQSYDKVSTPHDTRVRFACDGTNTPRSLFLSQIDFAANSLDLYSVITPEVSYNNANITHYDYRRERQAGVSMLLVDIWLQEVRNTVRTQFTNTKEATGAANVNSGNVQPTTPTVSQAASARSLGPRFG